jgi:D-threo-aldose 1-dehydrogenase
VSVIPGAVSPAQVRANAANAVLPIPPALWDDLKDRGLIDPDSPT